MPNRIYMLPTHLNMKNKKADGNMVWLIVVAALLLLFAIVYMVGWKNLFGKGTSVFNDQITASGDFDNDMIINFKDKCPCEHGNEKNAGCPSGSSNKNDERRNCLN